jgi:hypothetical protein
MIRPPWQSGEKTSRGSAPARLDRQQRAAQRIVAAQGLVAQFTRGGEVAPDLQPLGVVRGDFEVFGWRCSR